ncbi:MAG: tyrosine-type recombinase/integrase [Aquamicrobium sp.]|nr:tyrosine-type recombinase/integrase [Aquamicrobium sp.]
MPKVELTDRFCRSAKAIDGGQTEYFDLVSTGLSLLVSPGGTRTFFLAYTKPVDGKRGRMKIGRYPELGLAKAREKAREARGKVINGNDPLAERRLQRSSASVSDLVENYVTRHAASMRSGDEIARRLRKNASGVIGDIKLSELHRRDITKVIDIVKDRGAHIEANRLFEDVRAMVRWARARGDLDENLTEGMKRPTETVERDRVLSADEINTMWKQLSNAEMRETTRRVIRLCLVTAQRVGEVSGMERDEIDLDRQLWTIPAVRSKNKREHSVPLPTMAVKIIQEQLADVCLLSERKSRAVPVFVFPGPGARSAMTGAAVAKAIKRAEVRKRGVSTTIGIAPWTVHDLRRTAATFMEELGQSPFIVGHILNHVSVTKASITSRVYARYDYMKEKREALNLWSERLEKMLPA